MLASLPRHTTAQSVRSATSNTPFTLMLKRFVKKKRKRGAVVYAVRLFPILNMYRLVYAALRCLARHHIQRCLHVIRRQYHNGVYYTCICDSSRKCCAYTRSDCTRCSIIILSFKEIMPPFWFPHLTGPWTMRRISCRLWRWQVDNVPRYRVFDVERTLQERGYQRIADTDARYIACYVAPQMRC